MKLFESEIIYNRKRSTKQARLGFVIDVVIVTKLQFSFELKSH